MEQNFFLSSSRSQTSFGVLLLSLECLIGVELEDEVYIYLDNCFQRLVRKAILYNDLLEQITVETGNHVDIRAAGIDLLMIAATEQLPHLLKQKQVHAADAVIEWFWPYAKLSLKAGANRRVIERLCEEFIQSRAGHSSVLLQQLSEPLDKDLEKKCHALANIAEDSQRGMPLKAPEAAAPLSSNFVPPSPPREDERHRGLFKWTHEDVGDAIKDKLIGELIMCLCSEYKDIRLQALSGLRSFMIKLQVSHSHARNTAPLTQHGSPEPTASGSK